jgi:hypothetical protein
LKEQISLPCIAPRLQKRTIFPSFYTLQSRLLHGFDFALCYHERVILKLEKEIDSPTPFFRFRDEQEVCIEKIADQKYHST